MEKANKLMDSSSSEDEISSSILQEAIDQQFLKNNLYIEGRVESASEADSVINKPNGEPFKSSKQDKFTNFCVTDTFQNFIANKLNEILEKTIKLKRNKTTECFIKRKRNKNSGIKLLSTSKKYITTKEITKLLTKHKEKLGRCSQMEDDDSLLKFQEAAVSPESILNQSDMTVYSKYSKKPEFKYKKLKNGILIEA